MTLKSAKKGSFTNARRKPPIQKSIWADYLIPKSDPINIAMTIAALTVVWASTRFWWSYISWVLALILGGAYASSRVERSDFPLVSIAAGTISTIIFRLPASNSMTVYPQLAFMPFPTKPISVATILTAIGVIYTAGMAGLALLSKLRKRDFAYLILFAIMGGFIISGALAQSQPNAQGGTLDYIMASVPEPEQYFFDGHIYLRTFYLMKMGTNYYDALADSMLGRGDISSLPNVIFGWRLPTLFYFWAIFFGSGLAIEKAFLFIGAAAVFLGFLIAKELSNDHCAILAACLLSGYLFVAASTFWLPFMEYWALPLLLLAAYLYVRDRTELAVLPALLAPLIREIYIFALAAGFLAGITRKKVAALIPWMAASVAYAVFYALHYFKVKTIVAATSANAGWIAGGGFGLLRDSIAFSTALMFPDKWMAITVWIAGSIGLLTVKPLDRKLFLALAALSLPTAALFFGVESSYYWGVAAIPLAFVGLAVLVKALDARNVSRLTIPGR